MFPCVLVLKHALKTPSADAAPGANNHTATAATTPIAYLASHTSHSRNPQTSGQIL
jgi:hypothetical protein